MKASLPGGSLLILLLAAAAFAQAGRVVVPPSQPPTAPGHQTMQTPARPADEWTNAMQGQIARLNLDKNIVIVQDAKTGKHFAFVLDEKTKLKADKRTDLAGRKDISLADFKVGQPVRLTYRARDAKPLELRLRAS
jgi:hypothetical protein